MSSLRTRTVPLDDISIDSTGDGRTVTAYATVFDTPTEIRDQDGHYDEQIGRAAFDKSIAERSDRVRVFYNHGLTLHGTPSERASMPLGSPIEIRADGRGLLTRTRYNKTPLADEVLEAINNGDLRGQSFTGRMLASDPARGPYRSRSGARTLVTRKEIALKEYGPTPFPYYPTAEILGVRSVNIRSVIEALQAAGAVDLRDVSDEELERIAEQSRTDPTDSPAAGSQEAATSASAEAGTGEPDPDEGHHSRPVLSRTNVRARLYRIGVLK